MKQKEALKELKYMLNMYEPFFFEWIKNEKCTLTEHNLHLIESHIKNKFIIEFHKLFMAQNQTKNINLVVEKLIADYGSYKGWVIDLFFKTILELDKSFDRENTLETPIEDLNILSDLKIPLLRLNVTNLNSLLAKQKTTDLITPANFAIMLEFLKAKKIEDQQSKVPYSTLPDRI